MRKVAPVAICFIFFILFSTLSIIRHNHFGSLGFDLGIADQVVWEYQHFHAPITTVQSFAFQNILEDHTELIFAPLGLFYWVWSDARMLLVLQAFFISFSGPAVYLLARKYKLNFLLSLSVMVSFLLFYGIQNAVWDDAHSLVFGASFLSWYLFSLVSQKTRLAIITGVLAIISKENMPILVFAVSLCFFLLEKKKLALFMSLFALVYTGFLFGVYFPHFTQRGYEYQSSHGLIASLNPVLLFNTLTKQEILFYSYGWFGFLPFLSPILLIPSLSDLATYFLIGANVTKTQTLFEHYRVTLAPLIAWPLIVSLSKHKVLQNNFIAIFILCCALFFQYQMHLPLSYLTKKWFWQTPYETASIEKIIGEIPSNASLVSQNNITPHVTHRKNIFTLWPEKREFKISSPCGKILCDWFRWSGKPEFLIVDTGSDWDIRHFLADRKQYTDGLSNMEKKGYIVQAKKDGTTVLYKIIKQADQ